MQVIASYSKYFLTSLQAALFKLWPNSRNWNLTSCFLGSFFFIRKSFNWLGMFNLPKSCTFNKTPHFLSFQKSIQDSNQHWKLTSKKIVVQNTCYNSSTCRSYVPCPDDRDPGRGRFFRISHFIVLYTLRTIYKYYFKEILHQVLFIDCQIMCYIPRFLLSR